MEKFVYLTRKGYERLSEELHYLKNEKRREISKAIERARHLGDISENAEYDAAKEQQAHTEKRIQELEDKLSRTRIIENEDIPSDEVRIGASVRLKDLEFGDEFTYTLVSEEEANYDEGKISISSPVGTSLLGHKKGDEVQIQAPARMLKYKILDISR